MKVLMQGRNELFTNVGGDKVQIENTASELRKLGITVDISTSFNTNLAPYDLVHVFQLDWTPETYFYALNAKKAGKPLILSPIHHSLKEVKKFDDEYVFDFRRISKLLFNDQHKRDTFKNIYRSIFSLKKAGPTLKSIFIGLEEMHKRTLTLANVVLVQTNLEVEDLKRTYNVDFKWAKIPNGVGDVFLNPQNFKNTLGIENYILCVGRIEPRKNQLNIIQAVEMLRKENNLNLYLIFVGPMKNGRHFEYYYYFKKNLKKQNWIKHIEKLPYSQMPSLYKFAKVTVSASWFETTGLTLLESLFCGTNAVASGERAHECLGEYASYCVPDNIDSIKQAIKKEYLAGRPKINPEMMLKYTWENAAKKTLEVYKSVLAEYTNLS